MTPTLTAFAEALGRGDAAFRTLRDVKPSRRNGTPDISRTALFAEVQASVGGTQCLICTPLVAGAAERADKVAHLLRRTQCAAIPEYRLLRGELAVRNSIGIESYCDIVVQRLPRGERLDTAATHVATRRLEQALGLLGEAMKRAGVVHGNLKPSNIIAGDDGRLYPVRCHYMRKAYSPEECAAEIDALGRYVAGLPHICEAGEETTATEYDDNVFGGFDHAEPPHDMMRLVRQDGLYGYTDTSGRTVIAPQFVYAEDFNENRAVVETADGAGVIDKNGRYIIEPRYEMAEYDTETGLFAVRERGEWLHFDYLGRKICETNTNS